MAVIDKLFIYVIDGSEGFLDNPTDWIDSLFTIGDITVTSVADMVTKIEDTLGPEREIQNLFIGGHGAPGYQSVGASSSWDRSGATSLQCDKDDPTRLLGTAHRSMRSLASRFSSDAIVTLGGCNVGDDTALLKSVSNAIGGVTVQAGTDNQRPLVPGMEGEVIRCTGNSCTNLGGGSWWASPGSWFQ